MENKNNIIKNSEFIALQIDSKSINSIENVSIFDATKADEINYGNHISVDIMVRNFDFSYRDLLIYLQKNSIKISEIYVFSVCTSQLFKFMQFKNMTEKIDIRPFFEQRFDDVKKYTEFKIKPMAHTPYDLVMKQTHQPFVLNNKSVVTIQEVAGCSWSTYFFKIQK